MLSSCRVEYMQGEKDQEVSSSHITFLPKGLDCSASEAPG
jgi:hypothetical protein